MTTRFEQIAAAFPLHAQRIAELTEGNKESWLFGTGTGRALDALMGAFEFKRTSEGHDYWWALATGGDWK